MDEAFDLPLSPSTLPSAVTTDSPGASPSELGHVRVGGRSRTSSWNEPEGGHRGSPRKAHPPRNRLQVVEYAFHKAIGGGTAGAIAMVMNVFLLMWIRTTISYQYKTGKSTADAFQTLYDEGGMGRFYQGLSWALLLAPLARFGETAANEGVSALFAGSGCGTTVLTALAALCAAAWRIIISPIDMIKTEMQVNGDEGLANISDKIAVHGPLVLYSGSLGICLSALIAFYPFFLTHNFLQKLLPREPTLPTHARNAIIGLCSSMAAVVSSNPIKVLKTVVQTSDASLGYTGALDAVLANGGWLHGLVLRGLAARLVADGLSAIVFTVLWKGLLARWESQAVRARRGHSRKASKPHNLLDIDLDG